MLGLNYPVSLYSTPAESQADASFVANLTDQLSQWNQVRWTTS